MGALYCSGLTFFTGMSQNIVTLLFISFLIFFFFFNIRAYKLGAMQGPHWLILQIALIQIGIASAAVALKSPNTFFWVPDSINTHLPESIKFMHFFKGNVIQDLGILPGIATHSVTGFTMLIFGTNTLSTILAQLLFKIVSMFCIYLICKIIWDKVVGLVAILIYGLCPTLFFYNIVLYKESAVQCFIALTFLIILKIFIEKKYLYFVFLPLVLFLLQKERYYLVYLYMPALGVLFFNLLFSPKIKNYMSLFVTIAIALIATHYLTPGFFENIYDRIELQRINNSSYTDVQNSLNYNIGYPLALLKIIFTPYFTPNKFTIFSNTSLLLIWGSFINQIIILASFFGLVKSLKKNLYHIFFWIPFFAFLALAAYIAPWSGRLRDSFYPLIACYAAFFIWQKYALSDAAKISSK